MRKTIKLSLIAIASTNGSTSSLTGAGHSGNNQSDNHQGNDHNEGNHRGRQRGSAIISNNSPISWRLSEWHELTASSELSVLTSLTGGFLN